MIARLDAYFDPNERKYYVTPASVERAIAEEKAKGVRQGQERPKPSETEVLGQNRATARNEEEPQSDEIKVLRQEMIDLKIANRAKDMFIEQLQKEREHFVLERTDYVEKVMAFNRKVGELETGLLQLSPPGSDENAGPAVTRQ